MTWNLRAAVTALILSIGLLGCARHSASSAGTSGTTMSAVALIQPAAGQNVSGKVTFTQLAHGVRVVADVQGLTPGLHGFHIHEKGDLSDPEFKNAGPHFNPASRPHGGLTSEHRHAGDLGNLDADASGKAHLETVLHDVTLTGTNAIVGRSVIIHASMDDLKSQPAGNSGARIAGGVITAQP